LFASTKVRIFSEKTAIFTKYYRAAKFYHFFNISQITDFQSFAKKLQKRAKKSR